MTSYSLLAVGAVAVGLFIIRRMRASKWGVVKSGRRLEGQVVVITGANVGLGKATAMDLARRGATVVLACRDRQSADRAVEEIVRATGNSNVHFMQLDLGRLESVRQFCKELLASHPEVYALVCNAGVWVPMDKRQKTSDGFEIHAGVNHLGHFLIVKTLLGSMTADPAQFLVNKIVMVSSSLMNAGRLNFESYDHFGDGRPADMTHNKRHHFAPTGYCDSKLMNALLAKELAGRMADQAKKLSCVSVCPGWCHTQLPRHLNLPLYKKVLFLPFMFMFMRSAGQGAQNIIHPVVAEERDLVNGGFYRECKLAAEENAKLDNMADEAQKLWQMSERLCGL